MQLILFLLGLFAIGCVLYGISAGVQIVHRGFSALFSGGSNSSSDDQEAPQAPPRPPAAAALGNKALPDAATLPQRCISELQALFNLYQSGALTQQEFEQCKWHVLHSMTQGGARP